MRNLLAGLFLASTYLHSAFADSITSPRVPDTIRAGEVTSFFATVNSDTVGRKIYGSLIELIYGPSSALGNEVADIILGNGGLFSVAYRFPKSLSAGTYHLRLSCTTNSTSGDSPQSLSIRSTDIQITSGQFACTRPPPYRNVTSTTDPKYTGLYLTTPSAGDVRRATADGKLTAWAIGWLWRDERSEFGRGIDNFGIEFVQEDGSGGYKSLKTAEKPNQLVTSYLFTFDGVTVTPGAYNFRFTYTSVVQDGVVPVGQNVTYVSDPFYISGSGGDCAGLDGSSSPTPSGGSPAPGSSSGSTPGGSSGSSGSGSTTGAGSSQTNISAAGHNAPIPTLAVSLVASVLLGSYLF